MIVVTLDSNDGLLAALFMASSMLRICQVSLRVWAMGARAVVSVTIRRRGRRQGGRMQGISLCLRGRMVEMGIEILRRMRRVVLSE